MKLEACNNPGKLMEFLKISNYFNRGDNSGLNPGTVGDHAHQ